MAALKQPEEFGEPIMVKVINPNPHPSIVKHCTCGGCGAQLEYVPNEVKNGVHHDYAGGKDPYRYIVCPQCGKEVTVRP